MYSGTIRKRVCQDHANWVSRTSAACSGPSTQLKIGVSVSHWVVRTRDSGHGARRGVLGLGNDRRGNARVPPLPSYHPLVFSRKHVESITIEREEGSIFCCMFDSLQAFYQCSDFLLGSWCFHTLTCLLDPSYHENQPASRTPHMIPSKLP